jgi:hypothetical protein
MAGTFCGKVLRELKPFERPPGVACDEAEPARAETDVCERRVGPL